jgi:eukaryotic-like serine/threonine-protein kinase
MSSEENERLHDRHEQLLELAAKGEDSSSVGEPPSLATDSDRAVELPEFHREFGPYRLLRSLGHGGQGVVYLAEDPRLGRQVALKMISAGGAATEAGRTRFEREATSASRLHHPGICTVYEAGQIDGQRFLAMEFVDGESLPEWITRTNDGNATTESVTRRSRVERGLEIVEQLARAAHAAHEAGVVHRDLKPANVMLRRDGSPVILDFGLARDDSVAGETLTMQGDVLGTPAYMPPERVRGASGESDPREDVYGLGAILFECLTGKRPFEGHTREQLYRRILTTPVDDPRRFDSAIPREARFVVETALDKVADRRYATAFELAEDVRRLRQRQPIHARPVPTWLRFGRWVQRNPQAAVPTIATFAVLLVGIVVAWVLIGERGKALDDARVRALIGESNRSLATDVQRALREARAAYALSQTAATRSQLYEVLAQAREIASWDDHPNEFAAFFAAESRVVTVHGKWLQIRRVDDTTNKSTPIGDGIELPGAAQSASLDQTRTRIVVSSKDGVARVFSVIDGELVAELKHDTPIWVNRDAYYHESLVLFSPTDPGLILVGAQGGACLWRLEGSHAERVWTEPATRICHVAFAPDGAHFATGETDGTVKIFTTAGALIGTCQGHTSAVQTIAFDPSRELVVSGSDTGVVGVWSLDGSRRGSLAISGEALHLAFSPGNAPRRGDWLVVSDNNRSVHLWRATDTPSGFELAQRIDSHTGDVLMTSFSPDGRSLLTASRDGRARLFAVAGREIAVYRGGRSIRTARFSADGQRVVTAAESGVTRIWRTSDPVFRALSHDQAVMAVSASDRHLVVALRDGSAVVHDRATGGRHVLETGFSSIAWVPAISRDGNRLALGSRGGRVRTWDLTTDVPTRRSEDLGFEPHNITGLAFDPNGGTGFFIAHRAGALFVGPSGIRRELVKGTIGHSAWASDGRIPSISNGGFYWDLRRNDRAESGTHPRTNHTGALTVSPDSHWVATSGDGGQVWLFDTRLRRRVRDLTRHGAEVAGLAFSPDSRLLVSGSRDGTARLWDVGTGKILATLRGHRGGIMDCVFSPDGTEVFTGGNDGTVRAWPVDFAVLERLAEERSVR